MDPPIRLRTLPTFVINLDERKDRWAQVTQAMEKVGIPRTQYSRFSAIRPTAIIQQRPEYLPKKPSSYRVGCLGCLLSHYHIIKQAAEQGLPAILIMEDDIDFREPVGSGVLDTVQGALDQLRQTSGDPGFDMLYLSGTHMQRCKPHTANTVRVTKTYATHSYIIRSTLYDFLLDQLPKVTKEIDVFYTEALQTPSSRFRCFCVKPHVTYQRPGFSDIQAKNVKYAMKNP